MFGKTTYAFLTITMVSVASPVLASLSSYPAIEQERIEIPANITLTFGVAIDPDRSSAHISGPHGRVAVGALRRGTSKNELLLPLSENLPPGRYTVSFRAAAIGGKAIRGKVSITVTVADGEPVASDVTGAK